jgi:uncharacterized protein (TIGR03067 family)
MTRTLIAAASCMVLTATLVAETKEQALTKLQGKWRVERIEENGTAEPAEEAARFTITVKGTRMIVEMAGRTENTEFTIDPDKSPKEIDLTPQYGDDKGKVFRGIYDLEGDTLRICAAPSSARPTKFVSEQGTMLMVLKRKQD